MVSAEILGGGSVNECGWPRFGRKAPVIHINDLLMFNRLGRDLTPFESFLSSLGKRWAFVNVTVNVGERGIQIEGE